MKKAIFLLELTIVTILVQAQPPDSGFSTREQYINQYKEIAIREMQLYGIPASIKLAQAVLESGAGRGELAQKANNHFGIKCKGEWQGEHYFKDDDAPNECFRKYKDAESSFRDHSLFLTTQTVIKIFSGCQLLTTKAGPGDLKRRVMLPTPLMPKGL